MQSGARAEWHALRHVMVHEPGPEVFFALLSPQSHLYERFFNLEEAQSEHRQLAALLHESFGVRLTKLADAMVENSRLDSEFHRSMADLAETRMGRRCIGDIYQLPEKLRQEIEKPLPLLSRDPAHLLSIILLNPTIVTAPGTVFTELRQPLYNLYFMRDQQAATDLGMVQAKMGDPQRSGEVELSRLALNAAGTPPIHRIQNGRFEGGDFIPAGDFALVGKGVRTDERGIAELLSYGLSFDEVAVVYQPEHPLVRGRDPMISMHLDTYFNIAAEGVAVGNPLLLKNSRVEIYQRNGTGYERKAETTTLDAYIREKEFSLVEITTLEQLCYASNFLCVRDGECISPDTYQIVPVVMERLAEKAQSNPKKYQSLLSQANRDLEMLRAEAEFFPHKKDVYAHGLEMTPIALTNATGGYGGAHCMTCVLRRG